MSRLTEYFGWRDVPPGELTDLWCDHNLTAIDHERLDVRRLRKAYLKSIRDEKKLAKKKEKEPIQKQFSMFGNLSLDLP